MPAITITLAQLDALAPCVTRRDAMAAAIDWSTPVDAAQAVAAGATLDDIVWVTAALSRHDPDVDRRLRLWMADCAARVLHVFERAHPTDMRPREAIVAARRYARKEIDAAAWAAAYVAAGNVTGDIQATAAAVAATAACDATRTAIEGARAAANAIAWTVVGAAAKDARAVEERWQLTRLVAWLSADEPEDWPLDQQEDAAA